MQEEPKIITIAVEREIKTTGGMKDQPMPHTAFRLLKSEYIWSDI